MGLYPYKGHDRACFPLCFPPSETATKRWPSMNQELGPHQTLNLLTGILIWTSQPPEPKEIIPAIYKPPSVWYCYRSPNVLSLQVVTSSQAAVCIILPSNSY